jgi:hypothetical protein
VAVAHAGANSEKPPGCAKAETLHSRLFRRALAIGMMNSQVPRDSEK